MMRAGELSIRRLDELDRHNPEKKWSHQMSRARIAVLLLTGFACWASLTSWTGSATAAANNCPKGSQCKCVPTKFTNCTVDAKGKQTCTQSTGEKCTVISGPGSGKR